MHNNVCVSLQRSEGLNGEDGKSDARMQLNQWLVGLRLLNTDRQRLFLLHSAILHGLLSTSIAVVMMVVMLLFLLLLLLFLLFFLLLLLVFRGLLIIESRQKTTETVSKKNRSVEN